MAGSETWDLENLDNHHASVDHDTVIDEQRGPRDREVNVERGGILSVQVAVLPERDEEAAVAMDVDQRLAQRQP